MFHDLVLKSGYPGPMGQGTGSTGEDTEILVSHGKRCAILQPGLPVGEALTHFIQRIRPRLALAIPSALGIHTTMLAGPWCQLTREIGSGMEPQALAVDLCQRDTVDALSAILLEVNLGRVDGQLRLRKSVSVQAGRRFSR